MSVSPNTSDQPGIPTTASSHIHEALNPQSYSSDVPHSDHITPDLDPALHQPDQPPPPPDFKPFFTLIEDTTTTEHHHPTVHYIFTDDDPSLLTSACLDATRRSTSKAPHQTTTTDTDPTHPSEEESDEDVEDRFIIIDLSADGKEIVSINSLSADWQGVTARLAVAPSWEGSGAGEAGMMLRIEGREAEIAGARTTGRRVEDVDLLMRRMDERIRELGGVLGVGEGEGEGV